MILCSFRYIHIMIFPHLFHRIVIFSVSSVKSFSVIFLSFFFSFSFHFVALFFFDYVFRVSGYHFIRFWYNNNRIKVNFMCLRFFFLDLQISFFFSVSAFSIQIQNTLERRVIYFIFLFSSIITQAEQIEKGSNRMTIFYSWMQLTLFFIGIRLIFYINMRVLFKFLFPFFVCFPFLIRLPVLYQSLKIDKAEYLWYNLMAILSFLFPNCGHLIWFCVNFFLSQIKFSISRQIYLIV